jgi:hypothetical protein
MQFFTTELTSQKCNLLHGLKKKPRKRLQLQYYLKKAGFDKFVSFHLVWTCITKLFLPTKWYIYDIYIYDIYIYIYIYICQLTRHCDVTDSQQMSADKTFTYSYKKFRSVIPLRKPSITHNDTGELNSYINIYDFFLNERLSVHKFSFSVIWFRGQAVWFLIEFVAANRRIPTAVTAGCL